MILGAHHYPRAYRLPAVGPARFISSSKWSWPLEGAEVIADVTCFLDGLLPQKISSEDEAGEKRWTMCGISADFWGSESWFLFLFCLGLDISLDSYSQVESHLIHNVSGGR